VIDIEALKKQGLVKGTNFGIGVKVLSSAGLTKKLTLKVQAISATAKAAVEKLGGSVEIVAA
jgi:large subunit ribosomal protein L15